MVVRNDLSQDRRGNDLSNRVYRELVSLILENKMPPGTVINEVSLAKQLDVSRTPVHYAIRDLIKDGLVMAVPNKRPVVAKFSSKEIEDLFDIRALLEGEAARLASQRMDKVLLIALRDEANAILKEKNKVKQNKLWADFDRKFHYEIAKISGNEFLFQDICRYQTIHYFLNYLFNDDMIEMAAAEHLAILDAIEAKDEGKAKDVMVNHIQEWKPYYARKLEEQRNYSGK